MALRKEGMLQLNVEEARKSNVSMESYLKKVQGNDPNPNHNPSPQP
jgi:hypothetical protein